MKRKFNINRFARKTLSIAIALIMVSSNFPLSDISEKFDFEWSSPITVRADDYMKDPVIMSAQQLIEYSQAYQEYPQNHYDDTITISRSSDLAYSSFEGYVSLGTSDYPFAGSIIFNGTDTHDMNLDTALFDYVYDYVTIDGGSYNNEVINMVIKPISDYSAAVLANHVLKDDGTRSGTRYDEVQAGNLTSATWTVDIQPYQGTPHNHGSLIGELGEGAEITVNLINGYSAEISCEGNAGAICGTMGSDSTLTVASISGSNMTSITSSNGNAGGIVGEMGSGSTLVFSGSSYVAQTASITSTNHYAGGLVGKNDQATITLTNGYAHIDNNVKGKEGAGGVCGYYKPVMVNDAYSLSLDTYLVGESSSRCLTNSSGGAGGFFGVLENPGGTITLSGSNNTIYAKGAGSSTVFGGLIGKYIANSINDTLSISGASNTALQINTDKSGDDLSYYGGVIGKVNGDYFVSISDVNVTAGNPADECFGGAVAIIDTGYLYINNFALTANNYRGGGVVGRTESGVVHLAGTTNLSSAVSDTGSNVYYGQIVGYRDSALVFAESGWDLTRSSSSVNADDIGSWGEVVRFKSSDFTIGSVLSDYYSASAQAPVHYVTLKGATVTDNKIELSSKSTFATAALNMQINNDGTDTSVIKFEGSGYSTLKSLNVFMSADIDLSYTGMTGLTRDNTVSANSISPFYYGSEFDGKGHTLTLAIGAGYQGTDSTAVSDSSGKGMIYHHRYNGLFGATSNSISIKDVTVDGCVYTYDYESNAEGHDGTFYVGSLIGYAGASVNISGVTVSTDIKYGANNDGAELYVGGCVGKTNAPGTSTFGSDTASDSSIDITISGADGRGTLYVGGLSGYVGANGTVNVKNVTVSGLISNSSNCDNQKLGGLFAEIASGTNTLNLNKISLDGLTVKGKVNSNGSLGGLMGYCWSGVTATFNDIDVVDCVVDNDSTGGNMAGLVYTGSGYWKFTDVEIGSQTGDNGITLSGSASSSFGMLVNKAYSDNKAMYLELPSGYKYIIHNVTNSGAVASTTAYDEIAVYSRIGNNDIEANGNSIISINTTGTTKHGTQTDTSVNMSSGSCNTYQNQVTGADFVAANPNARYYYNLDSYKNSQGTGAQALFMYSVKQYAHSTINSYFQASSASFSGNLDLDGYSYYPFDLSGTVNISGNVVLHNEDIEDIETASSSSGDSFARTTLDTTKTQHYLMQAGLFRNVSGTVNINGALNISGTVPCLDDYCGALICGKISGSVGSEAKITSNNANASIVLNGIEVHNRNTTYSPLLINKTGGDVALEIYNVSATGYSQGKAIATSLIGDVGSDTSERVHVTFKNIKLDARTNESVLASLTNVYGTTHSLFTSATLLNSLTYSSGSGSYGVYNYEHSEDWPTDRNVTYGLEISDDASINAGKEIYYYKGFGSNTLITNPSTDSTSAGLTSEYDFTGFLPYVAVWGSAIGSSTTKHQLEVNHAVATFGGCGTYDHPFTIAYAEGDADKSGGLVTISKIIDGTATLGNDFTIDLPDDISTSNNQCTSSVTCSKYTYNGNGTFVHPTDSSKNKNLDEVRAYLAGAYYYLSTDIEIEANSGFQGLGNTTDAYAIFRGVIFGNEKTVTNKSNAPLIYASNGSVIKNLKVVVANTNQINAQVSNNQTFASNGGAAAYGAIIGRVMGGDNIIDKVKVDVSSANISYNYLSHVGGYIGVVVNGGVYFRNMEDSNVSAADKAGFGNTGNFASSDMGHLYCNPIIGRVINGFAVNETSKYSPYESGSRTFGSGASVSGNAVTIHNGNKNYSITDLYTAESSKLTVSGSSITVPNSQAFFVMSLIINSGMGTNSADTLGYYGSYEMTRHADYSGVNTYGAADYSKISGDVGGGSSVPYLIEKYVDSSSTAAAKTLGTATFALSVSNDLVLPDGYKGIGSIFNNNSNLQITLNSFNGNGKSISFNTTFYSYENGKDNYLPYTKNTNDKANIHGLALINYLDNTISGTTYKNCILSGNVKTRQYSQSGVVLNHTPQNNFTALSSSAFAGTLNMSQNAKIEDIYLKDIDIESSSNAAGMIGYLINDGKKLSITNTANNTEQSEEIRVSAGMNAGGLISRQGLATAESNGGRGDISINLNNHHFDLVSVVSRYSGSLKTSGSDWNVDWSLGVGGLIGPARGNNAGSSDNTITIENIIIGSENDTIVRTVACEYTDAETVKQGNLYVGGLVGLANRAPVNINNCTIYNLNIKSNAYVGGIVGWGGTASSVTVDGCLVKNVSTSVIYSKDSFAGGVLGYCKNDMGKFTLKNSTISGYIIEGSSAGGALGNWDTTDPFSVQNTVITDCVIKYTNDGGGIAGKLNKNLQGYNVNVNNLSFEKKGSSNNRGAIVGNITNSGNIKIVGFSRTGEISEEKIIGNNSNNLLNSMYGNGGYVVFANYDAVGLDGNGNTSLPRIGSSTVTGMVNSNTAKSPYVNLNSSLNLDDYLLIGDSVDKTAVDNILNDASGTTAKKRYKLVDTSIGSNISTFGEEFSDVPALSNKAYADMPILVVDDSTTAEALVNNYVGLMTNLDTFTANNTVDFSDGTGNSCNIKRIQSSSSNATIGTITIYRCTYNTTTQKFEISNSNPNLTVQSGLFKFRTVNGKEQYDTAVENGQFTIIDVAFKDPSGSDIAYHMYVPVIVKKLLEYNFDISVTSGSTYDQTLYQSRGNTIVENLGSPVTMEFEYTYLRSASEWQDENDLDYKYDKYLEFDSITSSLFDSTTKLVLVDVNRGGKEYYLDNWTSGYNSTTELLDLQQFRDASGNYFSPLTFEQLLTGQGMLDPNSTAVNLKEKYYITIFTEPYVRTDNNAVMAMHYSVTSRNPSSSEHPARRIDCEDQSSSGDPHYVVHLIMGDFFVNTLTVSTPQDAIERMSANNKSITVDMEASVGIVNNTTQGTIGNYLNRSNVTVYQSMLVSFDKYVAGVKNDSGITAIDGYAILDYTITDSRGYNVPIANTAIERNANAMEFKNNTDISGRLNSGAVTITLQVRLDFNSENTRLAQFPYKSANDNSNLTTGAIVIGSSNLSSSPSNTAYSTVSQSMPDSHSKYYYCESEESSALMYYADYTGANKTNKLDTQLGINGKEVESDGTSSFVQTEGRYDVSGLLKPEEAEYLKCVVKLYQKQNDGTYREVAIGTYLQNLTVISGVTPVYSNGGTYVFDIDDVSTFDNEDQAYKIPITFDVLSGNQTDFDDTNIYANYKVELQVSLFDHNGAADTTTVNGVATTTPWTNFMDNSDAVDFVIYTNARVYTDLITDTNGG